MHVNIPANYIKQTCGAAGTPRISARRNATAPSVPAQPQRPRAWASPRAAEALAERDQRQDLRPSAGGPGGRDGRGMFVAEDVTLGTGARAAQARFAALLHGSWLAEMSQAAATVGSRACSRWARQARLRRSWCGSAFLPRCIAVML